MTPEELTILDTEVYRAEEQAWRDYEAALNHNIGSDIEVELPPKPSEFIQKYFFSADQWAPTRRWEQGGPIIERRRILVAPVSDGTWTARVVGTCQISRGETMLIAAMRCHVGQFDQDLTLG